MCVCVYSASSVSLAGYCCMHSRLQRHLHSRRSCYPAVVCICMLACACMVLCNMGTHVFQITAPLACNTITCRLAYAQHPKWCLWLMGETASPSSPIIPSLFSPHLRQYLLLLGVWRHAHIVWATDWFLIVYISNCTPRCRCLYSAPRSAWIYTDMHRHKQRHTYTMGMCWCQNVSSRNFWMS